MNPLGKILHCVAEKKKKRTSRWALDWKGSKGFFLFY